MMARPTGHRDEAEIRQCIEEFAQGAKQKDLATKYGVRQPTISYWVRAYGKKVMGTKFRFRSQGRPKLSQPSDRDKEILRLVAEGSRYSDIARKFGISDSRVGAICDLWVKRDYRPAQG